MEIQEQQLKELNRKITSLLPETAENSAMIIVFRNIRDSILADYVNNGGTGWFGNA